MASLKEYRQEQLAKVNKLRCLGVNPYPARSQRDRAIGSVVAEADSSADQAVCLAGRLMSLRRHGQLVFIDLVDRTGSIQLICRAGQMKADYPDEALAFTDLGLLTRGDFIEAAGQVGRSQDWRTVGHCRSSCVCWLRFCGRYRRSSTIQKPKDDGATSICQLILRPGCDLNVGAGFGGQPGSFSTSGVFLKLICRFSS